MDILGLSGPARTLLAAALAFVPAIIAYVRGRQIARFADDPALPERLHSGGLTTGGVMAVTIAVLIALTGHAAIWAVPLSLIAYLVAGLPLRRILFNETWSLGAYLSAVIRFFFALWSFWPLVCALPALAYWAGERAWVVALVMGAGLFLIAERQAELIRWLIRARPLADEAIRARFDRLVAATGLQTPHFAVVDLDGGSLANAFALPSLRGAAVIFTGPLLERLDADETDAICAHELAHLEYYNRRRLRQRRLISRSLIAGAAVLTPLLQLLIPSIAWLACAVWAAVVVVTMAVLAMDRQKHETASDLRAVALTGNAEALVLALVKLHAIARVPRRWDANLERRLSHPSLKRRIQDIRAAAGTPPAALGDAAVFVSVDGGARVVFGDESLEYVEGSSAAYRWRYDRLSELRIAAKPTGEASLLVADGTGHRWQMPLQAADVPRIQAVLDIVDTRVETAPPAPAVQPVIVRAALFVVFILSVNTGLFAVSIVLGLALWRPEAPLVAAAGLAAMAGALLTWRDPPSIYEYLPDPYGAVVVAVLFGAGALLLWLAYLRRRDEVSPRGRSLVAVVAAATLASWLLPIVGSSGFDAVGLHQVARDWPSTVVLPVALAGAMMWSAWRMVRAAQVAAVVASVVAAGAGSQAFLDRFGRDVFLVPAGELTVRTLHVPVQEFTLPFGVSGLQLSPGGRSIAAVARRHDGRTTLHIGRAGEALTPIDADGALFIDDDRALVWTIDGSRTDLREVAVTAPESAGWQLRVTGLSTPSVSLDAASKRWRLAGRASVDVVEAREGAIGTDRTDTYRWTMPPGHGAPFMPIALSGDRALVLEPRPDLSSPITDPLGAFIFVLASGSRWRSTLWSLGPDGAADLGTSRFGLECHPLSQAGGGACLVFDASRTRFFVVDPETRGIRAVAWMQGQFFASEEPQGSWISGWNQSGLIAVRLAPADAIRILAPEGIRAHLLAVSDRAAAGVWYHVPAAAGMRVEPVSERTGTSIVRIYSVDR